MSEQKLVEPAAEKPPLPRQPEVNIGTAGHVDHGKCLRFDQYALVNGMPLTGQEIMDMAYLKGRLVSRLDGEQVYEFERNEVISVTPTFQATVAKSMFYVQEYQGTIYNVKSRTGRSVSISPEHPLLVNRHGRVIWVKARDLVVGDYLAFLSQIPFSESVEFDDPLPKMRETYRIVDWRDYQRLASVSNGFRAYGALNPDALDQMRIVAGIPETTFSRMIGLDWDGWKRIVNGKRELTNDVRARLDEVLKKASLTKLEPGEFLVVQKGRYARRTTRLKEFDLDKDLAKWFAFVWSEGSSLPGRIAVTQTEEIDMLREFLIITKTKLAQEVAEYEGGQYVIHKKAFVDYLRLKFGFIPGNKFESPILPWVCKLPLEWKATFLRWFISLDGEFNRKAGQISMTQANPRNIVMISYMLSSFGIVTRFGTVTRKIKGGTRKYTRLSISGRRNLHLFAHNIGFESARKQRALMRYLGGIKQASKESDLSIPVDADSLRRLLKKIGRLREGFKPNSTVQIAKETDWYKAYEGLRRTGRISRPKLIGIVQSIQDHLDSIEESVNMVPKNRELLMRHLELIGMSRETAGKELGMSRKEMVRVLERGSDRELATITDFALKKTYEILRETAPSVEQLRNLASTPLEFDRINTITTEQYDGKIYDLTVPDHANFVAGVGGIVSHNTTLTQAITGIWASAHSEELKRGITIKVGYADAAFYKCTVDHGVGSYSTSEVCPVCGRKATFLRAVSFVDCPGHESLMTNMLAGAFLMDGALLVIAANESVPKPQTREHLQALQMLGMKRIVIVQNKVDLVTDTEAEKNESQIAKFVQGTVAESAPIIPISAQQKLNIDALIEALQEVIPTPKRDAAANPLMYVVRSFDVNRPGAEIVGLAGGVLGGSLTRGELKVGEEVELKPGMIDDRSGKYVPIITKVSSLQTGAGAADRVGPGGLVAVGTHLDPTYTKGDQMVGSVIGKPGTLPETLEHVMLDVTLLETAVGATELIRVEKVKLSETLRLNLGTASALAVATSVRGDVVEADLKKPVAIEIGMRAAISRRIAERWRLIGSGVLK